MRNENGTEVAPPGANLTAGGEPGTSEQSLLEKVIRLHPDVWLTYQIAERARSHVRYPIERPEDFGALLDNGRTACFDGVHLGIGNAKKYFAKVFFPIENEDALIGRLLAALTWGRTAHQMEAKLDEGMRGME